MRNQNRSKANTTLPLCERCAARLYLKSTAFNLYISDLPSAFENILSDPFVLPNDAKLNCLFYADDLIILSRSKTGLKNSLDKLSSYCNSRMKKINLKKTKIKLMIELGNIQSNYQR